MIITDGWEQEHIIVLTEILRCATLYIKWQKETSKNLSSILFMLKRAAHVY